MSDYTRNLEELLKGYSVDTNKGRTSAKAQAALEKYGENRLEAAKPPDIVKRFLRQMKDIMTIILIAAAAVSFIAGMVRGTGDYIDSIIIIGIVIVNGVIGVSQEARAEKAVKLLKSMSAPTARVLRDGLVCEVPSVEVIPGDVLLLEPGDYIPADGRILESASLKCDESILTGEDGISEKDPGAKPGEGSPIGDRRNMVYSGSTVSYGRARVIVTATGMNTELGKIAELMDGMEDEPTPLQQKFSQLGKYLGFVTVAVCALIFIIGLFRRVNVASLFTTSAALAVAAVPEGLTAVVTVVLAMGVTNMLKKNAAVLRLTAVETLGSASVICTDKAGALTQNSMTVVKAWVPGSGLASLGPEVSDTVKHLVRLGALCNDGVLEKADGGERYVGDPTETALIAAANSLGMPKPELDREFPRVAELPFDSERKLMTTIHEVGGKLIAVVKGGYDVILPLCVNTETTKADEVNLRMAKGALRVLAVACRGLEEMPESLTSEAIEKDLMFMGLIGMIDPPREDSAEAAERCRQAGIKTVMITGDHVSTASAIARELGILTDDSQTISGQELSDMPDWELEDNIGKYRVFARINPEDKLRVVRAWQANGDVVAMIGDSVGDAPALREADIGCAMGLAGTDVAKSAADVVLTDDNFSTLVNAIEAGRGIYNNIRKTVQFLLGANLGEIFTVFFAILFGWGMPLRAIHLLLVNVLTDAFPAFALGVEPVTSGVMKRSPVPRNESIFSRGLGAIIILQGLMLGILTLIGYRVGCAANLSPLFPPSRELGVTMAFLVLSLSQLVHAFNCRSRHSLFKMGFFTNRSIVKAVLCSLAVIVLICAVPPLKETFHLYPISMAHWLATIGLSLAPLPIVELSKLFVRLQKHS